MKLSNIKKLFINKNFRPLIYLAYVLLILFVVYHIVFAQRIIPGVRVGNLKVGGMSYLQAKQALIDNEKKASKELTLKYSDQEYKINATDINLIYDWDSSVTRAFEVGRTGNFFTDSKDKFAGLFRGLAIGAFYDYDDNLFGNKYSAIKAEVSVEAKDASVFFGQGGNLTISSSKEGVKVIDEVVNRIFVNAFDQMDFSSKQIPTKITKPVILEDDLKPVLPQIQKIVFNQITVKDGDKSWVLDKTQLLDFLAFTKTQKINLDINDLKFQAFTDTIAQAVNKLPRGQVTQTEGDKVVKFELIKDGQELNDKEFKRAFSDAYFNGKTTVQIPFSIVSGPGSKEKYGIFALLGEGVSEYAGSIPGRIHNLTLAAERTNGVLVPPGGIYSLNNSIGDITAATGYDVAYIISEGRTVLGTGGGVCQVSTTVFRAALNAGLPIVQRYPHAYRVHYYEENSPVGFDASVFQPSWDFQFKNDTPNYVLVQSLADVPNNKLTFRIYGTPDGRSVQISDPVITNQTPPPPTLYQDDPTLPKGVTRQVDFSAWGASVKFTRIVKRGDTVLFQDVFSSNYQPWRAIFLVGTK